MKPTRGDQSGVAFGNAPLLYWIGWPFSSRNVSLSAFGLSYAVLPQFATSTRMPAVTVRFVRGRHSSWPYALVYHTSSGCSGSDSPGMFMYRTWKRRSVTGEVVAAWFAIAAFAAV